MWSLSLFYARSGEESCPPRLPALQTRATSHLWPCTVILEHSGHKLSLGCLSGVFRNWTCTTTQLHFLQYSWKNQRCLFYILSIIPSRLCSTSKHPGRTQQLSKTFVPPSRPSPSPQHSSGNAPPKHSSPPQPRPAQTPARVAGGGMRTTSYTSPRDSEHPVLTRASSLPRRAACSTSARLPFPSKRQASERWGMGRPLTFSDHGDISHSLRKTILKAGKQISLMNYLHQLAKHNNVSLET